MLKQTLLGAALAIGLVSALRAAPAVNEDHPPARHIEVGEIEDELAALHERMAELVRMRTEQVHREIAELHEDGRHEDAERLAVEARRRLAELHARFGIGQGDREVSRERRRDIAQEKMEAARQLFRTYVELHDHDQFEDAEDLLFNALEEHIDDPDTGELVELFVQRLHESDRHEAAEDAEAVYHEALRCFEEEHDEDEAWDDEFDPEQLAELHEEIVELREMGRHEIAQDLERELHEMIRQRHEMMVEFHDDVDIDMDMELLGPEPREMEMLERQIQEMHERGNHREAEELQRHLHEMMMRQQEEVQRRHDERDDEGEIADFERRMHHLHMAAENLHEGGLHDHAERLFAHIDQMHEQFRREHEEKECHEFPPMEEALPMIVHEIHTLRAEVAELRETVEQIKQILLEKCQVHREYE